MEQFLFPNDPSPMKHVAALVVKLSLLPLASPIQSDTGRLKESFSVIDCSFKDYYCQANGQSITVNNYLITVN